MTVLAQGWTGTDTRLIIALLAAIALVVVLISVLKLHAVLALIVSSLLLGLGAGMPVGKVVDSFSTGVGDTVASVGVLIALGAMLGKLLADSGGANQIVDTILARARGGRLPWALALVAALIGLPMFFEIGLILMIPIVGLIAARTKRPVVGLAIPALAGLSVLHGLIPPHPGPLAAAGALHANLGIVLGIGLLVAIPTVIIAGPLFAKLAVRLVPETTAPVPLAQSSETAQSAQRRPHFAATIATVLLPVVLMLAKAIGDILIADDTALGQVLDFIGEPIIALLAAVLLGLVTLGRAAGFTRDRLSAILGNSLGPIAGILLIVGVGGGFKQTLVDAGISDSIARFAAGAGIPSLLLGWLVAVAIRLATGSATVATVSAAGIVAPLAAGMNPTHTALLVLAVGTGSLFFSHLNDPGFWMVKEYFGLSTSQTIKTWSVMETIISVVALLIILPLGALLP
ncbi:gluconate:H+ symporter [Sciscionella sediminilitoris]|uniref:GntT/GntP/DsdX family permease n=1 Tax=Sciscionella sediminilitoris TaxID=1445613 RepID=UPI0004DF24B1|nr:gluconate:H+ symporter [Sciscionella sp. SE31]